MKETFLNVAAVLLASYLGAGFKLPDGNMKRLMMKKIQAYRANKTLKL